MKNFIIPVLMLLIACSERNSYNEASPKIIFSEFENPSNDYRAVPFWSLNDMLDSAELDRQIAEFARGGYGGVYLHSRTGLLTEYLGEDWWKAMDAGMAACERTGTLAWFYDEDKWPSGFAGGLVPTSNEDYRARCLIRLKKSESIPEDAVVLNEDSNYLYLLYIVRTGSAWFNGTSYVDLLNPAMVKEFIQSSYTPYAERYKKKFGKSALGIFTDEPQVFPITDGLSHDGALPFSQVLIDAFRKDNGYELIPVLSSLFDTVPGYEKVRLDYFRTMAKQLEASFSKQIGDYCRENNMMFTGHYNGEESFSSVRNNVGDLMLQLRNMQQPGLDHLGLHIDGALNAARSISSVSNQYGITRRLSEAYGISGQNMNFEDRAWIASWHTLNGINHICPHLALYSMKGTRKRDYPPTLSFQQPYWSYNKLLEDYVARLCYVSTVGKYATELLVVHPLESGYIEEGTDLKAQNPRNGKYTHLLQLLQENHRDYDLGDEQVIAEKGSVSGGLVRVGEQSYNGVILPYMLTIRKSTIDLLEEFSKTGGKIFALEFPVYVDGEINSGELERLKSFVKITGTDDFAETLNRDVPAAVTISGNDAEDVWTSRRVSGKSQFVQVTNTSRIKTIKCNIAFRENGDMILLDPSYGKAYNISGENSYMLLLHPAQSYILADRNLISGLENSGKYTFNESGREILTLRGEWNGRREDVNALTLDFARYSTDNGITFSKPEPVIGILERFTRDKFNGNLILAYDFKVVSLPASCSLVLEQPEMFSNILVNDKPAEFNNNSFYRDMTFKTTDVTGSVKTGANSVFLHLNYKAAIPDSRDPSERYGSEIESIYLTGDFAVKAVKSPWPSEAPQRTKRGFLVPKPVYHFTEFTITKEKSSFTGDLALQGYPFYNGSFVLDKKFNIGDVDENKKYFLKFPLSEAIIIKADLNGNDLPPVAWSPWEVDITNALKAGENSIKLTFVNSLRNLLGPHHNAEGELISLSPESFTGRSTWTTNRKGEENWYDLRLLSRDSTNIWRDDYCIIPFGLLKDAVIEER